MPDLKPTLGNAVVFTNGYIIACTKGPIVLTESTIQECMILPASRPIEQCPEEWKDGRPVWIWIEHELDHSDWHRFRFVEGEWIDLDCDTISEAYGDGTPTHIMLPPPSPQEATDAR